LFEDLLYSPRGELKEGTAEEGTRRSSPNEKLCVIYKRDNYFRIHKIGGELPLNVASNALNLLAFIERV
jgi:hypothetical protein